MTKKWLSQTPYPPRIPELYTLTKIHKPIIVGRPIVSGCNGPTERISAFVDILLQRISTPQKSYLKDSTDFINFIEKTKIGKRTFRVTMDVTSLFNNYTRSPKGLRGNSPWGEAEWAIDPWPLWANCITQLVGQKKAIINSTKKNLLWNKTK